MASTFTSGKIHVTDGDTITHDTTAVEEPIDIIDARIRWKGVTTSSSDTETSYSTNQNYDEATATTSTSSSSNTNSDSATATTSSSSAGNQNSDSATATSSTSTDSNKNSDSATATTSTSQDNNSNSDSATATISTSQGSNSNSDSATATSSTTSDNNSNTDSATATTSTTEYSDTSNWFDGSASATYPTISNFDHHEVKYYVSNTSSSEETASITWEYADGSGTFTQSVTVAASTQKEFHNTSTSTYYGGESRTVTDESGLSHIEVSVSAETYEEVINDKTASTIYPSVPSGYNFGHHVENLQYDDGTTETNEYTTNRVGETVSLTSSDPDGGVKVTLETYGTKTTINDKTASTTYPSVPSGYEFSQHIEEISDNQGWSETNTYTTNKVGESVSIDSSDPDRTVTVTLETYGTDTTTNDKTATASFPSVPDGYSFYEHIEELSDDQGWSDMTTYTSNKVGENVSIDSSDPDRTVTVTLETYGTDTVTNSKTATATYPSTPSGYNFDYHERTYNYDDGTTDTTTFTTNKVGETESLTSTDPNGGVTVTLHTYGTKTTINEKTASTTYPSIPDGYMLDYHERTYNYDNETTDTTTFTTNKVGESESLTSSDPNGGVTVTLDTYGGDTTINEKTASATYPSVPDGYNFDHHERTYTYDDETTDTTTFTTNKVGESESLTSSDPNGGVTVTLATVGKKTTVNSKTASVSYPSVPNGYSFDRHHWEKSNGNSDYEYTKNVSKTFSITSSDTSNTVWVEAKTRGKDSDTSTTYYYTQDPSVSGDVSASYNGTLSDGEWTSWISLNGFSTGVNDFIHSISDSQKAVFQFEYDYEIASPERLGKVKLEDNGSKVDIPLVDPSSPVLPYNVLHIYNHNDGKIYAFDVVDATDENATNLKLYHPTYGILAVRQYNA